LEDSREVALSDCVLGVQCDTSIEAERLRRGILNMWPKFAEGYRGTGAPYITLERAANIFDAIQRRSSYKSTVHHECGDHPIVLAESNSAQ
jgi:hypothetical protein